MECPDCKGKGFFPPCDHPMCYAHITHPCEGCGRLQGKCKTCGGSGEVDKKLTFTAEEMEQCFKAGCDFGRDMFNNPSNSEYVNGIILQKGNK